MKSNAQRSHLKLVWDSSKDSSLTDATSAADVKMLLEEFEGSTKQDAAVVKRITQKTRTLTTHIQHNKSGTQVKPVTGVVKLLNKLIEIWQIEKNQVCFLLGFEKDQGDYVRSILDGFSPLRSIDEKDRIANLLKIRAGLDSLFRNTDTENEWLREKQSVMGNKSPLDLILSGSMEKLLLVRQFLENFSGY